MSQSEAIAIQGPAGRLEAQLDHPDSSAVPAAGAAPATALLCHPHPRFGGSMHDAVLQSLADCLLLAGHRVVRFNFRGVGASEGSYSDGVGEAQDVQVMLGWLADNDAPGPILAGYSFGAAMAWAAINQSEFEPSATPSRLWLIAPPLSVMTFAKQPAEALGNQVHPQIIVGDHDDYCSVADAKNWLTTAEAPDAINQAAALTVVAEGDHFFSGAQQQLNAAIAQLLAS